jgi:hypothetical protein
MHIIHLIARRAIPGILIWGLTFSDPAGQDFEPVPVDPGTVQGFTRHAMGHLLRIAPECFSGNEAIGLRQSLLTSLTAANGEGPFPSPGSKDGRRLLLECLSSLAPPELPDPTIVRKLQDDYQILDQYQREVTGRAAAYMLHQYIPLTTSQLQRVQELSFPSLKRMDAGELLTIVTTLPHRHVGELLPRLLTPDVLALFNEEQTDLQNFYAGRTFASGLQLFIANPAADPDDILLNLHYLSIIPDRGDEPEGIHAQLVKAYFRTMIGNWGLPRAESARLATAARVSLGQFVRSFGAPNELGFSGAEFIDFLNSRTLTHLLATRPLWLRMVEKISTPSPDTVSATPDRDSPLSQLRGYFFLCARLAFDLIVLEMENYPVEFDEQGWNVHALLSGHQLKQLEITLAPFLRTLSESGDVAPGYSQSRVRILREMLRLHPHGIDEYQRRAITRMLPEDEPPLEINQ